MRKNTRQEMIDKLIGKDVLVDIHGKIKVGTISGRFSPWASVNVIGQVSGIMYAWETVNYVVENGEVLSV